MKHMVLLLVLALMSCSKGSEAYLTPISGGCEWITSQVDDDTWRVKARMMNGPARYIVNGEDLGVLAGVDLGHGRYTVNAIRTDEYCSAIVVIR